MRRYRSRINIARKRSLRRKATTQRLERRARKSAITATKRRFSGGKSLSNLSYSERARVERMTSRHKTRVTRLARRLVRVKRQQERDRIVRRGSR